MKNKLMRIRAELTGRVAIVFALFASTTIAFVAVAEEMHEGDTLRFDEMILRTINGISSPQFNNFFIFITNFGGFIGIAAIGTVTVAILLLLKRYRDALFLIVGVGGAVVINFILKMIFERTRPDLWQRMVVETSYSFPSGHALASSAIALVIIIICYKTKWFIPAIIIGTVYAVVIAYSRLYLGVHYPSDIIGGWLISAAWVIAMYWTIKRVKH